MRSKVALNLTAVSLGGGAEEFGRRTAVLLYDGARRGTAVPPPLTCAQRDSSAAAFLSVSPVPVFPEHPTGKTSAGINTRLCGHMHAGEQPKYLPSVAASTD